MTEKESNRIMVNVNFTGEDAIFLQKIRKLGIPMATFAKKAIKYYIPYYTEEVEILLRYMKAMENYSPNINEE